MIDSRNQKCLKVFADESEERDSIYAEGLSVGEWINERQSEEMDVRIQLEREPMARQHIIGDEQGKSDKLTLDLRNLNIMNVNGRESMERQRIMIENLQEFETALDGLELKGRNTTLNDEQEELKVLHSDFFRKGWKTMNNESQDIKKERKDKFILSEWHILIIIGCFGLLLSTVMMLIIQRLCCNKKIPNQNHVNLMAIKRRKTAGPSLQLEDINKWQSGKMTKKSVDVGFPELDKEDSNLSIELFEEGVHEPEHYTVADAMKDVEDSMDDIDINIAKKYIQKE